MIFIVSSLHSVLFEREKAHLLSRKQGYKEKAKIGILTFAIAVKATKYSRFSIRIMLIV